MCSAVGRERLAGSCAVASLFGVLDAGPSTKAVPERFVCPISRCDSVVSPLGDAGVAGPRSGRTDGGMAPATAGELLDVGAMLGGVSRFRDAGGAALSAMEDGPAAMVDRPDGSDVASRRIADGESVLAEPA